MTDVTKKPIKIFGSNKTPSKNELTSKKWSDGFIQQIDNASTHVNVQLIPIQQIKFDPKNARSLLLTRTDVENGPKLFLRSFHEASQELLQKELDQYFKNDHFKAQKIVEYISLAQLAASIQRPENLINPVTVYLKEMDFYLIAGHRRTLAHIILGETKIAAKILANLVNDFEHSLLQWKENKDREDLSLPDEIENIERIIQAWETRNNKKISIRKLMNILNIKQTKAAYYLGVINIIKDDSEFFNAIKSGAITSLDLAYNISTLESKKQRHQTLLEITTNKNINVKKTLEKIKLTKANVRPPNTSAKSTAPGLSLNKITHLKIVAKLLQIVVNSPELTQYTANFETLDLNNKKGILDAWDKIYNILANSDKF